MTSYGPVQWSKTASLNSSADVNVYVATGMAPSAVNDQFRSIMQSFSKYRDDNNGTLVTGGSTTAATIATNQVFTALQPGLTVAFGVAGTLDTSATLNVDGLGAHPIQLYSGTNITTGQIVGGTIVTATFVSTATGWIVQSAIENSVIDLMSLTGTFQGPITGGARSPATSITSSTTVKINYGLGPMQKIYNSGNFVIQASTSDGFCSLLVTNEVAAGTIATSGFTVSSFTGDAVATTVNNHYVWSLMTINGVSTYMIKALQ